MIMEVVMNVLADIKDCIADGKFKNIEVLVKNAVEEGINVNSIIDQAMIEGMFLAAERWKSGKYFIPEVLLSAKTMKVGMEVLKPQLQADRTAKATFAIGTVKGDLHDIGKNLVAMVVEGGGYEVIDLGVGVPPEQFVSCVRENPRVKAIGMSALLTTTMNEMRQTIEALKSAGLRERVKVFVGGAPINSKFAATVGADYYAPNAADAAIQLNDIFK